MTDNNQEEHSFKELFKNLKTAMAEEKGEIFSSRTVEDKYLDENLEIKPEYYKDVEEIVKNALMDDATEEDKEKLEEHMKKTELNAFRYRFTKTNENGNTEKYEYIFLEDKVIINVFDADNNLLNKSSNEFEYKNYSYILFYDIIKGLSEDGENSIFFKKNCYNSSIANIILRYYDKNDEFIDNQGSNFQTAVIEYIQKNNNLTYSNALMKALAEAGIEGGLLKSFDYKRNSVPTSDINGIAESAVIGGNVNSIQDLESKGVNFATSEVLRAACGRDDPAILNYLINNCNGIENILKDDNNVKELFEKIYHPEVAKEVLDILEKNGYNICEPPKYNPNLFDGPQYPNNSRPIHYIAKSGSTECMQFLLKKMSEKLKAKDMNVIINKEKDNNGDTMLINAVKNGKIEMVKFLLLQPGIEEISTIISDNKGESAIFHAIKNGNIEIVKILLQKFTKMNIYTKQKNKEDKTAIFYALENKHIDLLNYLLSEPRIIIDYNNTNKIFSAAVEGYIDINKISDKIDYYSFLHYTIANNKFDAFKSFIENKNIDTKILENLIPHIIKSANSKMLEFIVKRDNKIDLNKEYINDPFKMTETRPIINAFEFLVEPYNFFQPSPQKKEEYTKIIKILLETEKIDVNINGRRNINSMTPLELAIYCKKFNMINDADIIINLILKKTDVYKENKNYKTQLDRLIKSNNLDMVKNFFDIQPNIDINRKNSSGRSPLDYAIETGSIEMVTFLLSRRAEYISNGIEDIKNKREEIKKQKKILNTVMKNPYVKKLDDNDNFKKDLKAAIENFNAHFDDIKPQNECNIF